MEPTNDDEGLARKRKWWSAQQKLDEKLGALGLMAGQDYRFHGEGWHDHGIGVELRDECLMTAEFLVACSQALLESEEKEWGALVVVHDPTRKNKMRAIAEISNGGFQHDERR